MKSVPISPQELNENVFKLIGADWMLITAGSLQRYNMMTASWGGLGVLWNKNICFCVVRPVRYTYEFMEKNNYFTLCFFEEKYRKTLEFLGAKSGRQVNKMKESGLTTLGSTFGGVYFAEARLVMECKKIYFQDILPANFLDPKIDEYYPNKDYHRMYVGEILRVLKKD